MNPGDKVIWYSYKNAISAKKVEAVVVKYNFRTVRIRTIDGAMKTVNAENLTLVKDKVA